MEDAVAPTGLHVIPMWTTTPQLIKAGARAVDIPCAVEPALFGPTSTPLRTAWRARQARPEDSLGPRVLLLCEDTVFSLQAALALRRRYQVRGVDARLLVHLRWSGLDEHTTRYGRLVGGLLDAGAKRMATKADGLAFVSEWLQRRYHIAWRGPKGQRRPRGPDWFILRQPIDERFAAPRQPTPPPTGNFITITAFNLQDKVRGLDLIAAALPLARNLPPDWHWTILGDGPLRRAAEARIREALGDRVTFRGHVAPDALPGMLDAAELMLYASFLDAHPRAVLEALSRGLPVLVAEGSGATELVATTGCGQVTAATPEGFATGLDAAPTELDTWRGAAPNPSQFQSPAFVENLLALWPLLGDRP